MVMPLVLRTYQRELVERAVTPAQNVIIMAPPKTGKRHVAIGLVQMILSSRDGKKKVLHLNVTNNDTWSTWQLYKRFLPECKSIGIHAELNSNKASFSDIVEEYDVIVTTPRYFTEKINEGQVSLFAFSAVLVQQCEFAKGSHPYSKLFIEHLRRSQTEHGAPRVVGFTSTLIGAKCKSYYYTVKQVSEICATMGARDIIRVNRAKDELAIYTQLEKNEEVDLPNCLMIFEKAVDSIRTLILERLLQNSSTSSSMRELLLKGPPSEPTYIKWLSDVKAEADKVVTNTDFKLYVEVVCETLKMYRKAIEMSSGSLPKYGIELIRHEIGKKTWSQKNKYEREMLEIYSNNCHDLEQCAGLSNPRLDRLRQLLVERRRKDPKLRVVVSTVPLALATALEKSLKSFSELSRLRTAVWANDKRKPHLLETPNPDMDSVIPDFKEGKLDILFLSTGCEGAMRAIDFADMVIKYTASLNGKMTIQRRCEAWEASTTAADEWLERAIATVTSS